MRDGSIKTTSVGDGSSIIRGRPVPVPQMLVHREQEERYEYVILGAGCAGLSLCYYLLESGVDSPILILDHKEEFADDRTWCFWDVEPTPFSHLAVHSWSSWSLRVEDAAVLQTTDKYPYLCITGADFYEYILKYLADQGNVTLRLGEDIEGYKEHHGETYVKTSGGSYTARHVFDGRGLPQGSETFQRVRKESSWLPQKFLGQRLRARSEVFDPETCTLMDFSVPQSRGLRFTYVLPFTGRDALVENVYLSDPRVTDKEHRAELATYLKDSYGLSREDYTVEGEERGFIPMTDYRFDRRLGKRAYSIGMLGGESRPSTGYTFLRIQRYCRRLAESIISGAPILGRADSRRYDLLDGVFLNFMLEQPERCPAVYYRMFSNVPSDSLIRFLTEKSSPADDLKLVMAMPKTPFIGSALRRIFGAGPPSTK